MQIPFTATIKRTSDKGVQEFTEKGIWNGIMKFSSDVKIKEQAI